MSRNKLRRFEENAARHNVIEPRFGEINPLKGNWAVEHFGNEGDIVLELACGRGEYTVGLAPHYPEKNFIGVDVKGSRIWYGSGQALAQGLENVAFLRTRIDLIENHFAEDEIAEIWITFPDPRPKESDIRRRLTHPKFLDRYKRLLRNGGVIHLKTDNELLFNFTLEVLADYPGITELVHTFDLYHSPILEEHFGIRTRYEKKFSEEGLSIKYLRFKLNKA